MTASYTANLTITAQTAWDTWYAFSDRACNDTATAYRWYVATFFSEAANRRYQWIGQMIGSLVALAILHVQRWAEAEVQSCIAKPPIDADHIPDAGKMVEADPFGPTANPHYAHAMAATITVPMATLVVPVAKAKTPTTAELRKRCQSAGIKWRNAHAKGRHLSKGEMIAALQEMDCWALSEGCLA